MEPRKNFYEGQTYQTLWTFEPQYFQQNMTEDPLVYLTDALAGGKFNGPEDKSMQRCLASITAACTGHYEEAKVIARHAITAADWCLENGSLQAKPAAVYWPGNWAWAVRSKTYARWLLGQGLDRHALTQAAHKAGEWVENRYIPKGMLGDHAVQSWYVDAIRMALIGLDISLARELLERHKLRVGFGRQQKLYLRLLDEHPFAAANASNHAVLTEAPSSDAQSKPTRRPRSKAKPEKVKNSGVSPKLRLEVEELFDLVRPADATYYPLKCVDNIDNLRFELALIRQIYLVQHDPRMDPTPRAVIDAITA